jgi:hypothetical protein
VADLRHARSLERAAFKMFVSDCFDEMSQKQLMISYMGMGAGGHCMRAVTEYRQRARECRELARMVDKLEDKYALDCAAQSWERLAERREHDIGAED